MPAKSKRQQQLFGIALAYKRGENGKASPAARRLAEEMSEEELEEFARTKRKGLPERVGKGLWSKIRGRLVTKPEAQAPAAPAAAVAPAKKPATFSHERTLGSLKRQGVEHFGSETRRGPTGRDTEHHLFAPGGHVQAASRLLSRVGRYDADKKTRSTQDNTHRVHLFDEQERGLSVVFTHKTTGDRHIFSFSPHRLHAERGARLRAWNAPAAAKSLAAALSLWAQARELRGRAT